MDCFVGPGCFFMLGWTNKKPSLLEKDGVRRIAREDLDGSEAYLRIIEEAPLGIRDPRIRKERKPGWVTWFRNHDNHDKYKNM